MTGKLIIFSAPSGSGKSTIINYLLTQNLNLAFSISATSRPPRGTEQHGVEYFFLTPEEFRQRIENNEFLEYEEVYKDRYYGTLKAQVEKQLEAGQNVVFDVDVVGVLQQRHGLLEGARVEIVADRRNTRLAGLHEAARQFVALHFCRVLVDHRADALLIAGGGGAGGVGVAEDSLEFGEAGETEMLGEADDGRGLDIAGIGDVDDDIALFMN